MVTIRVSFYGVIKDAVSKAQVEIQMPANFTLRQLLDNLRETYGDKFQDSIFDEKFGVKNYVRFFLNKEPVDNFDIDNEIEARGEIIQTSILVMPASEGG